LGVSRGHGIRERQVLAYLRRYAALLLDLGAWDEPGAFVPIADIAGEDAPRSAVESVRRACKNLAASGLVELAHRSGGEPLRARLVLDGRVDRSTGQPLPHFLLSVEFAPHVMAGQHL
jgi:hypothetical protein